jgi:hypothetical protein
MGQAQLPGVVDATRLRDALLAQPGLVTAGGAPVPAPTASAATELDAASLGQVRDTLQRIEVFLERHSPDSRNQALDSGRENPNPADAEIAQHLEYLPRLFRLMASPSEVHSSSIHRSWITPSNWPWTSNSD